MANLTLTLDDDLLKKARLRALEQGTSVTALVREYLKNYAGAGATCRGAVADLLRLSRAARSRRGARAWTRDELHER